MAAFLLRMIPASLVYGTVDVMAWERYARVVNADKLHFYALTHVNWPPVIPWLCYFIKILSDLTALPFSTLIKIPSVTADCIVAVLIHKQAERISAPRESALAVSFLYALNPVSVLITSVHGQFDPLVILFCFLAWSLFEGHKKRTWLSALCLGIGIAMKGFPVILLPLFLRRLSNTKERLIYSSLALAPVALLFLPYLIVTPMPILRNVLRYSSRIGNWGYPLLAEIFNKRMHSRLLEEFIAASASYGKYILLWGLIVFYWLDRSHTLLESVVSLFALFYTLTSGFGFQYLVWIIPFAIIEGNFPMKWYTLAATLWLIVSYAQIISPSFYASAVGLIGERTFWQAGVFFSLASWMACLFYLIRR